MTKLTFNNGNVDDFTIILSTRAKNFYGQLVNVSQVSYTGNLNEADEICFTITKNLDSKIERLWNEIIDLKLVWVKEIDEFFEISVTVNENDSNQKIVTGKSLCEAELSQVLINGTEINTEDDILRSDYVKTVFYDNSHPNGSLLHRILKEVPNYNIKHVDLSLVDLFGVFSIDGTSIYDFLVGDCSETFHCIFQFDSTDRSISVYDLYTVCEDCGYRAPLNGACPKCGSTNLKYFGQDTSIFVSVDNLTDEIKYITDTDSIKNCFRLTAGDDRMTAAIVGCNPNGTNEIFHFSQEQLDDMSSELVGKIKQYNVLYNSYVDTYSNLTSELYETYNKIAYYTSVMMPDSSFDPSKINAKSEADKLTEIKLSPISLSKVSSYTSVQTVNSALLTYAKVFVKTGYVKLEIDSGEFNYNTHRWKGRFKVTSYSDDTDIAYSSTLNIDVNDDYQNFINQKIKKSIARDDTEDGSVYDVLSITNLETFKSAITNYCLNRLTSFKSALEGALGVIDAENNAELTAQFHDLYWNMWDACCKEIEKRSITISDWETKRDQVLSQQSEIQKTLNFKVYLGDALYKQFCSYKREDTYSNDNYISDNLTDDELLAQAKNFIETAQKELVQSGEYQHSITSNLDNLLIMEEFAPIIDNFELGNWIRISVDDKIYRLRLISYEIDFDDLTTINTKFSDLTKTADGLNDVQSVIKSAKSMATSYSYVEKKADTGEKANITINRLRDQGLSSALDAIKNADSEETVFDKHGIWCRKYDDISDTYDERSLKIIHNNIVFTKDNWKTADMALGEQTFTFNDHTITEYGLNSDFVLSGKVIAGNIYSANYSSAKSLGTWFNLDDGTFTLADARFVYDGSTLTIKNVNIDWSSTNENKDVMAQIKANTDGLSAEVSRAQGAEGKLSTSIKETADNITLEATRAQGVEKDLSARIDINTDGISAKVSKNEIVASINLSTEQGATINADKINLNGYVSVGNKFTIDSETGAMTATDGTFSGTINAANIYGGYIEGAHIKSGYIDGTNIFFAPSGTEVQPDDPMATGQGGIVYVQGGRWNQLDVFGSDELVLSTSRSVNDGGRVSVDRVFDIKRGATFSAYEETGYGWADWYYHAVEQGSVYTKEGEFVVESRNSKKLRLKASDSNIILEGTTIGNELEVDTLKIGNNNVSSFGYIDLYCNGNLSGCLFAASDAITLDARNNKDISLNASTGSGTIRYYGNLVQNSSERYKKNMVNITEEYADKILDLVPMEFDYKATGKHCLGLKAEQVIGVIPQIVNLDSKGRPDGVSYIEIIPLLVKKIQMLNKEINEIKGGK